MTPALAAALRCPVCGGPLLLVGRSLRCPKAHSFDLAKEGYANLLAIQKKHAADPGDGKEMVRARRAFLSAGHYDPLMQALAELCAALPHGHIVDAGCGEGSYDRYLQDRLTDAQIVGFDLSKEAVRLAAKRVPEGAFCVGGSFFLGQEADYHHRDSSGNQTDQGSGEIGNSQQIRPSEERAHYHGRKGAIAGGPFPEAAGHERNHAAGDPDGVPAGQDANNIVGSK